MGRLQFLNRVGFPALIFLAGITIGGAFVELRHRSLDRRSKELFEQRIRCKSLADQYATENSTDNLYVALQMVDFSSASNSCVAAFHENEGNDIRDWMLVDLLSGKATYLGSCSESRNCGNGKDFELEDKLKSAFKSAVDGTPEPEKLKK